MPRRAELRRMMLMQIGVWEKTTMATHPWIQVWNTVTDSINQQVDAFNGRSSYKCLASNNGNGMVTVVMEPPALATAVFELESDSPTINVTCPPSGPGIGRRGRFVIKGENIIVLTGEFVGQNPPPPGPLTPQKFADVILSPFLVP